MDRHLYTHTYLKFNYTRIWLKAINTCYCCCYCKFFFFFKHNTRDKTENTELVSPSKIIHKFSTEKVEKGIRNN